MAIESKELMSVGPGAAGYTQAHPDHLDGSLAQGVYSIGSAIAKAMQADEEDVHLIVGEGNRKLMEAEQEYYSLKGSETSPNQGRQNYEAYQRKMSEIHRRYTDMARTQAGKNEVSRRLDGYRTSITGKMFGVYHQKAAAQFDADTNAMLGEVGRMMASTSDPSVISTCMEELDNIVAGQVQFNAMSEAQARAFRNGIREKALKAAVDGSVSRGNYEETKALVEFLARNYHEVMGREAQTDVTGNVTSTEGGAPQTEGSGGGEHLTGSSPFASYANNRLESLRQKKSALEIVSSFKGANPFQIFRAIKTKQGKVWERLKAEMVRNNVSYDHMFSAASTLDSADLRLMNEAADRAMAPVMDVYRQQFERGYLTWEEGEIVSPDGKAYESPVAYYNELNLLADKGDLAASRVADRMWVIWHPKDADGSGNGGSPGQWAEYIIWRKQMVSGGHTVKPSDVYYCSEMEEKRVFPPGATKSIKEFLDMQVHNGDKFLYPDSNLQDKILSSYVESLSRTVDDDMFKKMFGIKKSKFFAGETEKSELIQDVKRKLATMNARSTGKLSRQAVETTVIDAFTARQKEVLDEMNTSSFLGVPIIGDFVYDSVDGTNVAEEFGLTSMKFSTDTFWKTKRDDSGRKVFGKLRTEGELEQYLDSRGVGDNPEAVREILSMRANIANRGVSPEEFMRQRSVALDSAKKISDAAKAARKRGLSGSSSIDLDTKRWVEEREKEPEDEATSKKREEEAARALQDYSNYSVSEMY